MHLYYCSILNLLSIFSLSQNKKNTHTAVNLLKAARTFVGKHLQNAYVSVWTYNIIPSTFLDINTKKTHQNSKPHSETQ